ncbi:MAG: polysaccharide deacetylase family protein [Mobilitalea sp.]
MVKNKNTQQIKKQKRPRKVTIILLLEVFILVLLFGGYRFYLYWEDKQQELADENREIIHKEDSGKLSTAEQAAKEEQDRLQAEMKDRKDLIEKARTLTIGYDYEGAIDLIKSYKGNEGGYQVYKTLVNEIEDLEKEQDKLVLYGGVYGSVTEVNHLFFHTLIADTSLAFDGDSDTKGYNMYMVTVQEFKKMLQSLYDQNYVLVRMSDLVKKVTLSDGSTSYEENEIYLREGKKPIVLSEDDVAFYDYMLDDGFASKIVLDSEGKPTCEMLLKDGNTVTGSFDIIPILNEFIKEHPDFSYRGAKGLLALTGYEGVLGYRTNDKTSPNYEKDLEAAKEVVAALKEDGWEFASHSWGHKDMQAASLSTLKSDTDRWLDEVGAIVGPTNMYVFPFGNDIETTTGTYKSDKYEYLKEKGFDIFLAVYKEPWMHIKKNYVRMTRRPIDGQALLEFPERLKDLFNVEEIIDAARPVKNW